MKRWIKPGLKKGIGAIALKKKELCMLYHLPVLSILSVLVIICEINYFRFAQTPSFSFLLSSFILLSYHHSASRSFTVKHLTLGCL